MITLGDFSEGFLLNKDKGISFSSQSSSSLKARVITKEPDVSFISEKKS